MACCTVVGAFLTLIGPNLSGVFSYLPLNGMLPTSRLDVLGIMDGLQNKPWEHLDNNKNKLREGS